MIMKRTKSARPDMSPKGRVPRLGATLRLLALGAAMAICLAVTPGTGLAQEDYSFIGIDDAKQIPLFITRLQKAVADGDKQAVAKLVSYPLVTVIEGKDVELDGEAAFVKHYDQIMTEALKKSVLGQSLKPEDVFVNKQGVMVGDSGQIWVLPDGDALRISEIREP